MKIQDRIQDVPSGYDGIRQYLGRQDAGRLLDDHDFGVVLDIMLYGRKGYYQMPDEEIASVVNGLAEEDGEWIDTIIRELKAAQGMRKPSEGVKKNSFTGEIQ